jgi:superfamily I DNA/RNA helicase
MATIEKFLSDSKSLIIAPAGYGKTHTITACVKQYNNNKKILILTHTHAGIASIKEKMKKEAVSPTKYSLDTISSFALQYTNAYHFNKNDIPIAENGDEYFRFAIITTTKLLKAVPIKEAIRSSYSHIIVDEYQDCDTLQHQLIVSLSEIIPTHLLGDPLQGIFGFKEGQLVDMMNDEEMQGFKNSIQELSTPWRWINANAQNLGDSLATIRESLLKNIPINLMAYSSSIRIVIEPESNLYKPGTEYKKIIWSELSDTENESLLIIHPDSSNLNGRIKVNQQFRNSLRLIESIDTKEYYKYASEFDTAPKERMFPLIYKFSLYIFNAVAVNAFIKKDGKRVRKSLQKDKEISSAIEKSISKLSESKSFQEASVLINIISHLPEIKCYRKEFLYDLQKALQTAHNENITVYDAMKKNRDIIRRVGRKVKGKCIGTTLLTKGLEFDTVIVLNAHKFNDPRNFYVAITRACKKLIIFSENTILRPYSKNQR